MSYILHIETATTVCSVAISRNDELIFLKELNEGFTHAENLHLFIQQGFREANIVPQQLSAVAVSKGPGSYTGLRIGVSSAKGLAFGLNIPLIGVDTLQVMAASAISSRNGHAVYCPMIDARRMEVYTSLYDSQMVQQTPIEALILNEESIKKFEIYPQIFFFGDGMPKSKDLLSTLKNAAFMEAIVPSAQHMVTLAFERFQAKNFENVAYFEPFYLKDFLAGKKKAGI